jgi:CheY-like chemotaxis protein
MLKRNNLEAECRYRRRFKSVLVLEDDGLLSLMLEDLVLEEGALEVHACHDVRTALDIARTADLDCAILDVSLRGEANYEVADLLADRGVPFLFCTGLNVQDIAERHRDRPILAKPYSDADFRATLAAALAE